MEALYSAISDHHLFGVIAFVVTVFATPLAAIVARKTGVMDMPDTFLKPHARPIPYLGGTAICLGWAVALVIALVTDRVAPMPLLPLMLGGIAMSLLGLADDVKDVSPKTRLAVGAVIIAAVMISTGTGFRLADSLIEPLCLYLPDSLADPLRAFLAVAGVPVSVLLGIFIVLGACNSANLIDGLDGLCSGVTAIIALGFFLLAAHLYGFKPEQPNHQTRLILSIALLGATLGFLPMNFNPARIFMGDAGSVLLGFNCGIMILLFAEWGIVRWVAGALMIFALPIFDTALAMFRRWRSGRSIFAGDRSHFYDQLVQRGMTVKQAVLTCYGLTLLFAALGLLIVRMQTRYALPACVLVAAITAIVAWKAGLTNPEAPPAAKEPAQRA